MKEIKVVIGKNFGDEGKGQAVSDLCRGRAALVVRHNGGAQAGHTVEEGRFRFVFHQIGSGSLWGCPTYWSSTFLPDLLKLGEEAEGLLAEAREAAVHCDTPVIYAHPDCACTVIYDVLLNSLTEQLRGVQRHGSCGMGIYEAVLRSRESAFRLCLKDFAADQENPAALVERIAARLDRIRREYTRPRLRQLRVQYPDGWDQPEIREWVALIEDDNLLRNVAEEMCAHFTQYVKLADLSALWGSYERIVFENAQGLMLDEDNQEYYPHLTPSHTGLYNVARLLTGLMEDGDARNAACGAAEESAAGIAAVEIMYVTRTYVTRHGAGRLDHECLREAINPLIEDATNIPNPWQKSLRFARHPASDDFFRPIFTDLEELKTRRLTEKMQIAVTLRLTHLDETDGKVLFADGDMEKVDFDRFCEKKGIQCVQSVRRR